MSLDISNLSANIDYSSLLSNLNSNSRNGGNSVLSSDVLTQWTMLRANSKAAKAAAIAEDRGYLRDRDAPKRDLLSETVYKAADRSTTIKDILKLLGREPTVNEEETATETDAAEDTGETADKTESTGSSSSSTDGSASSGTSGSQVDVLA